MLKRLILACLAASALSQPGRADPSFDCHTNLGLSEQTICANADLAHLDTDMSQLYFSIANDTTGRYYRRLKRDQRQWLRDRDDCGANVRCLRIIYRARIQEFNGILYGGD